MLRGLLTGTALGTVASAALLLGLSQVLPVVEIEEQAPGAVEAAFGVEPPVSVLTASPAIEPTAAPSVAVAPPAQTTPVPSAARPALASPSGEEVAVAPSLAPTALTPTLSDVPPVVASDVTGSGAPPSPPISANGPNTEGWVVAPRVASVVTPAPPAHEVLAALTPSPPASLAPRLSDLPPPAGLAVSTLPAPPLAQGQSGEARRGSAAAPPRAGVVELPVAPSQGAPVVASAEPPPALRPRLSDAPPQAGLRTDGPAQPGAPGLTHQEAVLAPWSPTVPVFLPPRPVPANTSGADAAPPTLSSSIPLPPLLAEGPTLPEPIPGAVPGVPETLTPAARSDMPAGPLTRPSREVLAEALSPLPRQARAQTETVALAEPAPITDPRAPTGLDALSPPVVDAALSKPLPARPPVSGEAPVPLGGTGEPPPRVLPRITVVGQEAPQEEAIDAEPEQPALIANAVPFESQGEAPLLGVVLVDGSAAQGLDLSGLSFPLAVAVDPLDSSATARMAELRAAGLEVLVLAPVAPGAQATDLEIFFEAVFSAVPEAVAVMDLPDSALQRQRGLAGHAVAILKASGHGFVTYDKGLNAAVRLAEREAVPVAKVARIFDEKGTEGFAARRMLDQGAFQAGRDGRAVLLGSLTAQALEALAAWQQSSKGRSVQFAPVSAVLGQ